MEAGMLDAHGRTKAVKFISPKAQPLVKKKRESYKETVASPYRINWTGLQAEEQTVLFTLINTLFPEFSGYKIKEKTTKKRRSKTAKKSGEKRKHESDVAKLPGVEQKQKMENSSHRRQAPTNSEKLNQKTKARNSRKDICLGVNEVTRALERDDLCGIVLCHDAKVKPFVSHIPIQARYRKTPICFLLDSQGQSSVKLGMLFGIRTAICFGLRKHYTGYYDTLKNCIASKSTQSTIPWLLEPPISNTHYAKEEGKRTREDVSNNPTFRQNVIVKRRKNNALNTEVES